MSLCILKQGFYQRQLLSKSLIKSYLKIGESWCFLTYCQTLATEMYYPLQVFYQKKSYLSIQYLLMQYQEYVDVFLGIVSNSIQRAQAIKFLTWGKGDLTQALNYYYNSKQKNLPNQVQRTSQTAAFALLQEGRKRQSQKLKAIRELRAKYFKKVQSSLQNICDERTSDQLFQKLDYLPKIFQEERPLLLQFQTVQNTTVQSKSKQIFDTLKRSRQQSSVAVKREGFIFIGTMTIKAFNKSPRDLSRFPVKSKFQIRVHGQTKIPKGRSKQKLSQDSCIYMMLQGSEIGRLEESMAKTLIPLLNQKKIFLQGGLQFQYGKVDYFSPVLFRCQVYFNQEVFTRPITQQFQNQLNQNPRLKQFGKLRAQFASLLNALDITCTLQSLIKLKDQKNQASATSNQKRQKVDHDFYNPFSKPQKLQQFIVKSTAKTGLQQPKTEEDIKQDQKLAQFINLNSQSATAFLLSEPSPQFQTQLHQYQKQALTWMLNREGVATAFKDQSRQLHPLWAQFRTANNIVFYFNSFSGQLSMQKPLSSTESKGGILADQMGLGKTVMILSLIATNPGTKPKKSKQGGSLIVLPVSLLSQWQQQINLHFKQANIVRYYGKEKCENIGKFDIVLTTYGTVARQFADNYHQSKKGLYQFQWFRVVLDQAHYIRGRIIQSARAVFALRSRIRWCLTGTPIQNKIDDLFSLIHFIRLVPWSDYNIWNCYISKPYQQKQQSALDLLKQLIRPVFMRRVKETKGPNGQNIINLPAKAVRKIDVVLNEKQRQFYDSVSQRALRELQRFQKQGGMLVKFMNILQILVKLQQICCHPVLFKSRHDFTTIKNFQRTFLKFVQKRAKESTTQEIQFQPQQGGESRSVQPSFVISQSFLKQTLQKIAKNHQFSCPVCLTALEDPVITVCAHLGCRLCLLKTIEQSRKCPSCRKNLSKNDIMSMPTQNRTGISFQKQYYRSSKIQRIMQQIQKFKQDDKAVIFSQFLGMLDLIEFDLQRNFIGFVRLDGTMNQASRDKVIKEFRNNPKIKIFLISLKAGGVGLNLVAANKVFMVNSWWNPAVQDQAIQRIHRIGQKREVQVIRFVVQNSVQSRMQVVHSQKRALIQSATKGGKRVDVQTLKYLMRKY